MFLLLGKPPSRLLLACCWCFLGAPTLYSSAELATGLWNSYASRHWSQTVGTVVEHTIRGRSCFTPTIRFEYMVDGRRFESDTRVPAGLEECVSREFAQSIVHSQPPGSRVQVHYNPSSPESAVLSPGVVSRNAWVGVVVSPLFVMVWLYIGRLLFRSRTPSSAA
jgi:hypothetical protein